MPIKFGRDIEIDDRELQQFIRRAPKVVRDALSVQVKKTGFVVGQRIRANARVGPLAPHIKDDVEVKGGDRGSLTCRVGYFGGPSGGDATQPEVALFEEYRPNHHPFMRPAADAEANDFASRLTKALRESERALSVGSSL